MHLPRQTLYPECEALKECARAAVECVRTYLGSNQMDPVFNLINACASQSPECTSWLQAVVDKSCPGLDCANFDPWVEYLNDVLARYCPGLACTDPQPWLALLEGSAELDCGDIAHNNEFAQCTSATVAPVGHDPDLLVAGDLNSAMAETGEPTADFQVGVSTEKDFDAPQPKGAGCTSARLRAHQFLRVVPDNEFRVGVWWSGSKKCHFIAELGGDSWAAQIGKGGSRVGDIADSKKSCLLLFPTELQTCRRWGSGLSSNNRVRRVRISFLYFGVHIPPNKWTVVTPVLGWSGNCNPPGTAYIACDYWRYFLIGGYPDGPTAF